MDHRVSKDMISSGMSYTGQKSQEELGGSQYGSVARPDSILEAYTTIYSEQTGPALPGENRPGTPKAPGGRPHLPGEKETPAPKKPSTKLQLAGIDLFDTIKGHLLDEGLSEDEALYLMINMTEEEKEIVAEASYSAKAARAGKDIGKPGKQFSKIAASAAKRYGSEERGKKVAGAILAKLRAKKG